MNTRINIAIICISFFAMFAGDLCAQGVLEEVVVTARKRQETLQEVPVAVTAFTGFDIQTAGIERPQDYISLMPNVTIVDTANTGDTQVSIRGIVSTRDAEGTFAYVVDGVLITNPNAFNEELLDVAQIEVVKGPQGALYGRNAVAGAVLVTTNRPDEELGGKVKAGVGNESTYKASGTINLPLSDDAAVRVSAYTRETDGFYRNDLTERDGVVDFLEDRGIRGRLVWDMSERSSLDFRAGYSKVEGGAINFNAVFAIPPFVSFLGSPAFFADVNDHEFVFGFNVPGEN